MKRRKVWLGLGTAVLVSSQLGAKDGTASAETGMSSAVHRHHSAEASGAPMLLAAAQGSGGEGDEGGKAADYDANLAPAVRFYRDIELIRGHLLVGDELVREKRWAEALPHFLHPSEEIYGKIRGDLKTYEVPPSLAARRALPRTVKAKNEGAHRTALAGLEERLAAADKGVKAKAADWQPFVV